MEHYAKKKIPTWQKFGFDNNYIPIQIQNCNIGIAMIHLSGISSRGINCIETHD